MAEVTRRAQKWRYLCGFGISPLIVSTLAMLAPPGLAADDYANGRRIFLEKADCAYCHGWAGDGAGQGQSAAPPICGAVNWDATSSLW